MDYGNVDTNVSKWLEDMKTAQRLGVPNMAWGVGVGRIWTQKSKKWIEEILPKADTVIVRDKESAFALSEYGVKENVAHTCDPALMLPHLKEFERKHSERPLPARSSPKIVVCLRHWYVTGNWTFDEQVFSKMKQSLARVLSHLARTMAASVTFVPLVTDSHKRDDDREVEEEVRSLIKNDGDTKVIDHVPDGREFMQIVSDSDLLIGMRLHSLIFATAIGVPCVAISYDDKVRSYMSSIGASNWTLTMEGATFENLRRLADDALNGVYPAASIREMIENNRKSAGFDLDKAIKLIESSKLPRNRLMRNFVSSGLIFRRLVSRRKPKALFTTNLVLKETIEANERKQSSTIPMDA